MAGMAIIERPGDLVWGVEAKEMEVLADWLFKVVTAVRLYRAPRKRPPRPPLGRRGRAAGHNGAGSAERRVFAGILASDQADA